jgi:hypothetical protein
MSTGNGDILRTEDTRAQGTGHSIVVTRCQVCGSTDLKSVLFLGYLPPVNKMVRIGTRPFEQPAYPAELLSCPRCHLVQLGLVVDPEVLFPADYPYTSSTTKILRENFAELYSECSSILALDKNSLIVDVGSNDGNLLSNFVRHHRVLGVTPEEIGRKAVEKGIPTIFSYFNRAVVDQVLKEYGKARIVTATNVFAHMENIHEVVEGILALMDNQGVFISESHYWPTLVETLQYDTIYHEHLRYYSLTSLTYLLSQHGLEIFHAKKIPTHGGSIRVYAARKEDYPLHDSVRTAFAEEKAILQDNSHEHFKAKVVASKLRLASLLGELRKSGKRIFGISAPSRATTLINYAGLDDGILDCVVEIAGSHKIGNYLPGTLIPILDEAVLFKSQPDYVLLLSWHIADELAPKLRAKGFRGSFITPLPEPKLFNV